MSNLNKVDIPVAQQVKTKLDLTCDHITSMDFMALQPVYYRHMLAGEKLNISSLAVCRPSPMSVPTYGRMRLNLRGFWIPFRLTYKNWHSWHQDVIATGTGGSRIPRGVPFFTGHDLYRLFLDGVLQLTTEVTQPDINAVNFDFVYSISGTLHYYKFTHSGRRYYKILYSLGYDLVGVQTPTKDVQDDYVEEVPFNAFNLLSLFKLYYDWYCNAQYLDDQQILSILRIIENNDPNTQYHLTYLEIGTILALIERVNYDTEGYFENAWDNPVAPTSQQFSAFQVIDPTYDLNTTIPVVNNLSNGTPQVQNIGTNGNPTNMRGFSQYIDTALKKLTDYQHRHALAGARSIDRTLAQLGFATDYLRLQRSVYVGFDSSDINIGDIYATANGSDGNNSSVVGDYAGRGFGRGQKTWDFTAEEDGVFMIVATIIPSAGYVQGYDRNNRHLSRFDFFDPTMDGLGVQAIEKGEVFCPHLAGQWSGSSLSQAFGFTGRYGEYKRPLNRFSGDLSLRSVMAGGRSWSLFRFLDFGQAANVVHSENFTKGLDGLQYHRIFNFVPKSLEDAVDPFYVFFHFDVGSYCPCKPLFETYEFDDDEKKKITLASNGTELN